jgi:hypothetical protein
MKTDEDVVRDLLVQVTPEFDPVDASAVRTEAETVPNRTRTALWAVAAAVLVVVIAVAVVATRRTPGRRATASARTASTSATDTVPPGPKAAAFLLELKLPGTRFPADGTSIHAELLAINNTDHAIAKHYANCDPFAQVGLSAGYVRFDGTMSGDVLCSPAATLRPGVTHIPVTIATTYQGCQQGRLPGTRQMPHCMGAGDSTLPPLPPGRYRVNVVPQQLSVTPALSRPIWITLLPR